MAVKNYTASGGWKGTATPTGYGTNSTRNQPGWAVPIAPSPDIWGDAPNMQALEVMLPYLSPEDKKTAISQLYRSNPQKYAQYVGAKVMDEIPVVEVGTSNKLAFTSQARAEGILKALNKLQSAKGQADVNSDQGFLWLKRVAELASEYGNKSGAMPTYSGLPNPVNLPGEDYSKTNLPWDAPTAPVQQSGQTRAQYRTFIGNLDALMKEAETDSTKAAYKNAATMITQPFFSAGSLTPKYETASGKWVFGEKNKSWT